ncbi:MAG: hypothetical protein WBG46_04500 [Nonlabens sp.]
MHPFYNFDIPEPCHEDWNSMTPSDQGRFCSACEKTVIDFTDMQPPEIAAYLKQYQSQQVCGRVKSAHLNQVIIKIPTHTLQSHKSPTRIFMLALLIVMGTTLFSCTSDQGRKTKIDNIEVVGFDSLEIISCSFGKESDSLYEDEETPIIGGFGSPPPEPPTLGEVVIVQGMLDNESSRNQHYVYEVGKKPQFQNSPDFQSQEEALKYFQDKMSQFVKTNFDTVVSSEFQKGERLKINTMFTISELGNVEDIKVHSRYLELENEARRVLDLLPKLVPARHDGKDVSVTYALPIILSGSK